MKKKIITASALAILIFVFTLWLTLPYENFVIKGLSDAGKQAGISISYADISSGPLSTTLKKFEVDGNPIGTVKIYYSPLKLMTGKISYKSSGAVNAEGNASNNSITFKGKVSSGLINSLIKDVDIEGDLQADIKANPEEGSADFTLLTDKLKLNTPLGPMDFEKVNANAVLENNKLTLNKLTSEDSMALDLKGNIRLNNKDITRSFIDISGTVNFMGQKKELTLKGLANNIQPSIR